jgi:hypothetical protein
MGDVFTNPLRILVESAAEADQLSVNSANVGMSM